MGRFVLLFYDGKFSGIFDNTLDLSAVGFGSVNMLCYMRFNFNLKRVFLDKYVAASLSVLNFIA